MPVNLSGKTAIVTGAGTGIGRGIAIKLAQSGAKVAVHYYGEDTDAQETLRRMADVGGEGFALPADFNDARAAIGMVEEAISRFGRLDILVNNAANTGEQAFFDVTPESWDGFLDVTLKAAYFCSQAAAKQMMKQGGGKLVFIGSVHGEATAPNFGPYAAAKGAIKMVTRQLALELAPHKINVNAVAPGIIEVERYFTQFPWYDRDESAKNVPWGRVGFPEDIANMVAFLSSEEADFVTGQTIYVDGGQTAKLSIYRADLEDDQK